MESTKEESHTSADATVGLPDTGCETLGKTDALQGSPPQITSFSVCKDLQVPMLRLSCTCWYVCFLSESLFKPAVALASAPRLKLSVTGRDAVLTYRQWREKSKRHILQGSLPIGACTVWREETGK